MTETPTLESVVRPLQIVVGGMMAGVLSFLGITLFLAPLSPQPDRTLIRSLAILLAVGSLGCAAAYVAQRQRFVREVRARRQELQMLAEPGRSMIEPYRLFIVAGAGLIEGPTFFSLMIFLLSGEKLVLAAPALALTLLALHFPTAGRLRELVAS